MYCWYDLITSQVSNNVLFPNWLYPEPYDFRVPEDQEWFMDDIIAYWWNGPKGLEYQICWSLGDTTWKSHSNCNELAALDCYLRLQGVVSHTKLLHIVSYMNATFKFPHLIPPHLYGPACSAANFICTSKPRLLNYTPPPITMSTTAMVEGHWSPPTLLFVSLQLYVQPDKSKTTCEVIVCSTQIVTKWISFWKPIKLISIEEPKGILDMQGDSYSEKKNTKNWVEILLGQVFVEAGTSKEIYHWKWLVGHWQKAHRIERW